MKMRNLVKSVQPRSFYVELAEQGELDDFLKTQVGNLFETDKQFHNEMLEIMYNYSKENVVEIEMMNLEKICQSLSYFLEYLNQWKTQKR